VTFSDERTNSWRAQVITGSVTSPIMIYWFSAYFNEGKPCYTKAETATAGCKLALSKLVRVPC